MKNIGKKIIIGVVILVMLIPIIVEKMNSGNLKEVTASTFESFVSDTNNHKFALLYIGNDDKTAKSNVKEVVDKYDGNSAKVEVSTSFMDVSKLSSSDALNLFKTTDLKEGYVFAVNGEVMRIETSAIPTSKLNSYVKEYTSQGVDESIRFYKTLKDADEYKKLVNDKKKVTMAVLGRDSCAWCNLFKPVYNTAAEEYNFDVYYVDSDSFDQTEYGKIMDLGLVIPASCNDGKEAKVKDGFGTPLTLFTKNGKVIDCISGYVNKEALITKVKTVGLIKE